MGSKYMVNFRNYGDAFGGFYQTDSYLKLIFKLISLKKKYDCIDIQIRK